MAFMDRGDIDRRATVAHLAQIIKSRLELSVFMSVACPLICLNGLLDNPQKSNEDKITVPVGREVISNRRVRMPIFLP